MPNLAVVYKRSGQAHIGIFDKTIKEFHKLTDEDGLYDELDDCQFMVVNVLDTFDLLDMQLGAIQLITPITIINRNKEKVDVLDFLEEISSLSEKEYQSLMTNWYEHLCVE